MLLSKHIWPSDVLPKNLADKVANMLATCRHDSQMLAHFAQMPLSWRHNFDPDTFFVSGFSDIHPFLLRVPEVHTENSSISSDMRVTVGVAKRYLVSDNAKKIKVVTQ
jgi:hypothetical protein